MQNMKIIIEGAGQTQRYRILGTITVDDVLHDEKRNVVRMIFHEGLLQLYAIVCAYTVQD